MRRSKTRKWQTMQKAVAGTNELDPVMRAASLHYAKFAGQFWVNDKYTVLERRSPVTNAEGKPTTLVWLSIHDKARSANRDWREFQRIKNDIIGPEEECLELYPAESRMVDGSNEFHLWCVLGMKWPFGFQERLVSEGGYHLGSAKQRPWSDTERPQDCREITKEEVHKFFEKEKGNE